MPFVRYKGPAVKHLTFLCLAKIPMKEVVFDFYVTVEEERVRESKNKRSQCKSENYSLTYFLVLDFAPSYCVTLK